MRRLLVWALIVVGLTGCAHGTKYPDEEPGLDVVTVKWPVPCIVEIAELGDPALPVKPPYPGDDAPVDVLKDWALALGEAVEQREAILLARDRAWAMKVQTHNAALPLCSELEVPR